jgi:hypothetical protein
VLSFSVFGHEPLVLKTVEFKTTPDGKSVADVKTVDFQVILITINTSILCSLLVIPGVIID